jgi:2-phosphosulfolactate phosphatase
MRIERATLETCDRATGTAVVIDVLRAFTTAAYAFAAGAAEIRAVSRVEEALALREALPGAMIAGEIDGYPIDSFDFGNSPAAMAERDLTGRTLIQRTSSGTQGLVRSRRARRLLATGLCCAQATVDYIRRRPREPITLVITGAHAGGLGDEDAACADYLEALLLGRPIDVEEIVQRVWQSQAARKFLDPGEPVFQPADLAHAVAVDRFDFALAAWREDGHVVLKPVHPEREGGR